ncbi:MAG: hypothetical protein LKJ90_09475 [Faecalibacterium sp.]|jgi:uncharacterized repeat protein (TIGR01451 family)|nr:hypothetical protein [Faecalibacterium sp.]
MAISAVLQKAADEPGSCDQLDTLTPDEYGQKVNLQENETISAETATYTAIVYYHPDDLPDLTVTPIWYYKSLLNTLPAEWNAAVAAAIDSRITTTVQNTDLDVPQAGDAYYSATYDGYHAIKSVLKISNIPTSMYNTATITKYFFQCGASAAYSTSAGTRARQGTASLSGGLVIGYSAYLHHNGVNVYERENTVNGIVCNTLQQAADAAKGNASVWTYPQLEIHTPYEDQINTVVVRFQSPYSSQDTISYSALPSGVISLGGPHIQIFQAATKNTISKATWETFLRSLKITVYDKLDTSAGVVSGGAHLQWWISEDSYVSNPSSYKFAPQLNSYYTVVWASVTQPTARAAAEKMVGPLGIQGHLIRFNSATGSAEATYLHNNVVASGEWWTDGYGGYWAGGSGADAGGPCVSWTGLTGTYLFDDFSCGGEGIWLREHNGRWQLDDGASGMTKGYIVEYNIPSDLTLTETDHSAQDTDIIGTNVSANRTITVQADDAAKVYDGTELMATATFSGSVPNPEQYLQAVYTSTTPTAGYPDTTLAATAASGSRAINAGSYTVTWELNYDGIQAGLGLTGDTEGALTITQRPLTVHSLYLEDPTIARNTKAYDGTAAATISNFLVDNRVPGDLVWPDKDHYAGTYATAQASETLKADGTAQDGRMFKLVEDPITRTEEMQLAHDPNQNYYIKEEKYSGAICRCTMSAFVGNFTSVYGDDIDLQPTVAETYSATESGKGSSLGISVLMGNDTLTIDPEKSWFALPDVGSTSPAGKYPVKFEGLTEANYPVLSNYILWQQPGNLTITPRPLVIRTGSYSKVYGDPMPQFSPIFNGFLPGDNAASDLKGAPQWITDASATADVGRYEVQLVGYEAKDNVNGCPNYIVYMLPGTLEITKRPITITPTTDPDLDPMPELRRVSVTKAADRTVLAVGDTVHYTITITNTGTVELQNVLVRGSFDGSGQLIAADGQGYTYASGIFTIARLPVGKSITLACSYTAQAGDAGHDLTNTAIVTVPGKEPNDPSKEYPSDPVVVPVDPDKTPDVPPDAGAHSIFIHKTADIAFAAIGDTVHYTITVTNTGTEDLTNITVQDIASNVSGDITPLEGSGYAWEGKNVSIPALAAGETVTIRFTYTVQAADAGRNLRDYALATVPGTNPPDPTAPDTGIDPLKPLTPDVEYPSNEVVVPVDPVGGGVAADPKVKTYGDADPALTYTLSEAPLQCGDIWGALERVPGEDVGVYPILQGTLQSKNYDITYIPAIFRIKPATLTVAADNKIMTSGQMLPKLTAKVTGFRFSDTLETATNNDLRITTTATQGSGAGIYPITPDGLTIPANSSFGEENYTVKYKPGLLTILGSIHPATGDSTPLLPLILCGGACLGMYGALAYRKKKNMK